MNRGTRRAVALALTALLIGACSSGDRSGSSPPPSSVPSPSETAPTGGTTPKTSSGESAGVTVENFDFTPKLMQIDLGTTVTWTNLDSTTHVIAAGAEGATTGLFGGGLGAKGSTYSFTFETAGTFDYLCSRHPAMTATVKVAA